MKKSIEREIKLRIPSREQFNKLVNWEGEEFGGWEANFKLSRRTIHLDTVYFDLAKHGFSLSLIPNLNIENSKQNKLVLKQQLSKYDKQELIYEFDNEDGHISEHIKKILPFDLKETIEPIFIINQIRHKRGMIVNRKSLYISIDEVHYLNIKDINAIVDTLFVCELESSERIQEDLLSVNEFQPLIEIIQKKFDAKLSNISKYDYAKSILDSGIWKTSNLYNSDEQWQDKFIYLKNRLNTAITTGTTDKDKVKEITLELDHLVNFSKVTYYNNLVSELYRKRLNQSLGLRDIWFKFINSEKIETYTDSEEIIYRKIFNDIYNKDINFDNINDSHNNSFKLTKENYSSFLSSTDHTLRKNAFENLYKSYNQYKNVISSCLDGIITFNKQSHLQYSVTDESLRKELLEFIMQQNNRNIKTLHQYMELRKQKLKSNRYSITDIQFPINHESLNISYRDAQNMILEAFSVLDLTYQNQIKFFFSKGFIDITNSKNKRSGSYLIDAVSPNWPFISINFQSDLQSLISLAHELGHAIANIGLPAGQSYRSVPQLTAEIHASIFESIFMHYVENNLSPSLYLDMYLEKFRANYFRSMLLSEFEILIYEIKRSQKVTLNSEVLSKHYNEMLLKYYGSNVELPKFISLEWTKVPFFYNNPKSIIAYPIAFIIGEFIAQKILNNEFDMKSFLEKSSSKDTYQLLTDFNIDLLQEEIYLNFFNKFKELQSKY
ncbi:Oligoendopeptidase F [Paenibacillus polysaccharolyticus]|uniref:Oligoendopeptidase F n=1 Tax=Paenibacillus polysaccharolyticus TaxID=582692 RepID=A0A1G5LLZ9_9BACL|nr:hypothetical protein [Paenibacillus polysaccharolyticus]SCZ13199.1 Oligoendopeptidase F [Paenibacillus polysaccharolyticus]